MNQINPNAAANAIASTSGAGAKGLSNEAAGAIKELQNSRSPDGAVASVSGKAGLATIEASSIG